MSCGCGGACCHDEGLHGLGIVEFSGLGFIGLDAKAQGAIASSGQAGRIVQSGGGPIYVPGTGDCSASGVPSSNVKLAQTASGLALTGVQVGLLATHAITAAALAPWTLGISALIGIFPMLFAHHAAAVKEEQSVLCTAVPAANNYLDLIDQAVSGGQVDAQHALAALDSCASDFRAHVSGIYKDCNAACVMQMCLDAAIATERQRYTELAQQEAASVNASTASPVPSSPTVMPSRPNVVIANPGMPTPSSYSSFFAERGAPAAASSLPSWLPIAAAALVGLLLVRS